MKWGYLMTPTVQIDFNTADSERVFRLLPISKSELEAQNVELEEGVEVIITDNELWARARIEFHDGMWVAVVEEWLESSPGGE